MSEKGIGILFAVLGVVLFSTKAVMVKMAYGYGADHLSLLLFRMVFAVPAYIGIAIWKKPIHPQEVQRTDFIWLIFFGVVGYYMASLFDFMGLNYIKAGLERIILFIYPTIVVLLSWLIFKKKITITQSVAIAITYIGVVITFSNEIGLDNGQNVLWGGFLIFLSALTYAVYLVGSGWLIPKFGVLQFTSYAMIVSTACIIVHYLLAGDLKPFQFSWEVYLLGAAMAFFATLIPSFLVSAAIQRLGASTFSIFGSLGPVSTIILAYFLLDEQITLIQLFGILVVIAGVAFVSKK